MQLKTIKADRLKVVGMAGEVSITNISSALQQQEALVYKEEKLIVYCNPSSYQEINADIVSLKNIYKKKTGKWFLYRKFDRELYR